MSFLIFFMNIEQILNEVLYQLFFMNFFKLNFKCCNYFYDFHILQNTKSSKYDNNNTKIKYNNTN